MNAGYSPSLWIRNRGTLTSIQTVIVDGPLRRGQLKGSLAKPHHAAAYADREDDHASGNDISEMPCIQRD